MAAASSANLDGRGERPVPQLCMICHGGQIPQGAGGVPFGTAAQVKLDSRFLPFDHRFFTFPTNPASLSKANQEASIKNLNEQIVNATAPASTDDPIREVVSGLYKNGTSATQILNFTVPGWADGVSPAAPNFYQKVLASDCRTCHIAQPFSQLQFNTSDKFVNLQSGVAANNRLMLGTAQMRVCGDYTMPHALRTHDIWISKGSRRSCRPGPGRLEADAVGTCSRIARRTHAHRKHAAIASRQWLLLRLPPQRGAAGLAS